MAPRSVSQSCVFDCDKADAVERFSSLITDWEPSLSVKKPPSDAILYEPDGTLYAIALSDCVLEIPRRIESLGAGDMVVIPRGFPVDAGPSADLLALCHDGPAPDHFRERFIQVRGFDIPAVEDGSTETDGLRRLIPPDEVRFRVSYAVLNVSRANGSVNLSSCPFLRLVIAFEGEAVVRPLKTTAALPFRLPARSVIVTYPDQPLSVEGNARLGILEIPTDLEHDERRALQFRRASERPSPEFRTNPIPS